LFSQTNLLTMFRQTNLLTMFSQTNLLTTSNFFLPFWSLYFRCKINVVCVDHKLMGFTQSRHFQMFKIYPVISAKRNLKFVTSKHILISELSENDLKRSVFVRILLLKCPNKLHFEEFKLLK